MYLTGKIKLIIILCTSLLTCHNLTADDQIKESLISDNHANYSKEEAQTSDEPNLDVILNHYVEAIEKKEGEDGPYSHDLPEMLYSLEKRLQSNNRFDEAIGIFRKAIYVNRINDGLYSLSQEATLRAIIESQKTQGKIEEVATGYSQLLQVYLKNYEENDPKLLVILDEFSNWALEAYSQTSGRNDSYHLETAFDLYSYAIRIASAKYGGMHPNLLPFLNNLATTCYYLSVHQRRFPDYRETDTSLPFGYRSMARVNQVVGRGAYYKHGQILQNQILQIYDENPNFTLSEIAEGQTNLGDWYLLFGKYKLAMTAYEKSYEIVAMDQQSKKNLDKIYSQPLMLPKRTRYSYAEKNEVLTSIKAQDKSHLSNTTNYVNLTVDITDGGNPVNFDVKEIYPPEMDSFGTRAIETIRMKKFRPQLIKGSPVLSVKYPIRVIIPNE